MSKKELKWGETPWDKMDKFQLLREVQRMYSALVSLNSVARILRHTDERSPFWGYDGSGGRALEKARQVLEPLDESDTYSAFFRYADDLLFDTTTGYRIGSGWAVCPECGQMIGTATNGTSAIGTPCSDYPVGKKDCGGVFRKLQWSDLINSR